MVGRRTQGEQAQGGSVYGGPVKTSETPTHAVVGQVEEVRVEKAEEVHERAVLRALESQMGRCAEAEEVEDIKEQIRLAIEWVTNSRGREQPRWIVPPGTEEENRKEALARARRLVDGVRKQCLEVEEVPEGVRPSKWRGLRRGRGGQMRFIEGDGDVGEQEGREEGPARDEEGPEPGWEADGRVERGEDREGVEEGDGAAEGGGRESAAREGVDERDSAGGAGEGRQKDRSKRGREGDEQEPPEGLQRGEDEDGTPKRKRARRVRYGGEQIPREDTGAVREGVTVYGPHKVRGKWRMYVGTVEEMIEQQDRTGHVTKAAILQWEDQGGEDEKRMPYPVERLQVCPQGREMEVHGQLVPEQEARELEGEEVSSGGKNTQQK